METMDPQPARPLQGATTPASTRHRPKSLERPRYPPPRHDSFLDADSSYPSLIEPPTKLRKTQAHVDKSKGVGIILQTVQTADIASQSSLTQTDESHLPALPYPVHQTRVEPSDPAQTRAPPRESLKNGHARAGVPSPPHQAPRHPSGFNDYFPWERNHSEDVLTESITRTGYFDKAQNASAELVSARPSVISCIKNKVASDALSNLIVASLERRQQLCSVSARNTFKPPPRVTLTDNKKEAWLKDLADGAIPLRRLSRTIPHGIRGKILLEHCLAKRVPTWRAIWLVKCVGSNEIRTFRRKGAGNQSFGGGGEIKWLKDWTDGVLDFIDSLAKSVDPKQTDGREHVTYALSLISQVYHQHLLDQDLFNGSIIKRLRDVTTTNANAFCLWTSVVGHYLPDMLKCRRRGCDLVRCLLSALEQLEHPEPAKDKPAMLTGKCKKLLTTVLSSQPTCFLLPESWPKYSSLVRGLIQDDSFQLLNHFEDLQHRNALLASGVTRQREPDMEAQLDQFDMTPDPDVFMATLQRVASDNSALIRMPIDWCTSYKRSNTASVYLVARVIRLISKKLAYSCQEDISQLLASVDSKDQVQTFRLHMLTAELIRSHHFSVSKYLHFLLARGISGRSKAQLAVLAFIPRQALSAEVLNLALSMCSGLNFNLLSNKDEVDFQVAAIQLAISRCRPTSGLSAKDHAHISSLDAGTRSAIALHLRKDIATKRAEQSYPSPDEHDSMDLDTGSLQSRLPATLSSFELLQDYPTLADVLLLFIPTADVDALLTLSLCVKFHHRDFQAMSAFQRLFTDLLKRYAFLHQNASRSQHLTRCIIDLARLLPNAKQTIAVLQTHHDTFTENAAAITCSPMPDQNLTSPPSSNIQDLSEIDVLLQPGPEVEEQALLKALAFLMRQLESSQHDPEQMSKVLKLLRRAAESAKTKFNAFLAKHLHSMLGSADTALARRTLPWIVAGELCPVDELIGSCLKPVSDASKRQLSSRMALNVLLGLVPPPSVDLCNCVLQYYSFSIIQQTLLEEKQEKLNRLAELALQIAVPMPATKSAQPKVNTLPEGLEQIVSALLCNSHGEPDVDFEDSLVRLNDSGTPVEDMLCRMIKLHSETLETQASFAPITLLHKVSEIVRPDTAAPCRVLAQIQLNKLEKSGAPLQTLEQAALSFVTESSVWRRLSGWHALTRKLSDKFTSVLHETALEEVIKIIRPMDVLDDPEEEDEQLQKSRAYIQDIITILEGTHLQLCPERLLKCFDTLLELVGSFETAVTTIHANTKPLSGNVANRVDRTLGLVLHLIAIHTRPSHLSAIPHARAASLLLALFELYFMLSPTSLVQASTTTTLLDIILHLARCLSEEEQAKCLLHFRDSLRFGDVQVDAILGSSGPKQDVSGFLLESGNDTLDPESPADTPRSLTSRSKPFNLDPWEMLQDTTPLVGSNDTCLSLSLFGARKSIF